MPVDFHPVYLPYSATGNFSKIVLDYVSGNEKLKDFFEHDANLEGIKAAILQRKKFPNNRELLFQQMSDQYKDVQAGDAVVKNIDSLKNENTFTICTAHQPNIFTGHLYFIYKILQTIKLSGELKTQLPAYHFVPVFFMGSEDADLEELNHVIVDGKKYTWETSQTGAVGKMLIDDDLVKLIGNIAGRISVEPYGNEIIGLLKESYKKNKTIQEATFHFVHALFSSYGLLVLVPDNAAYKRSMREIFEEDLFDNTPSEIVSKSSEKLGASYKVQAHPREINLFYLKDGIRNRIIEVNNSFVVHDTELVFTKQTLQTELDTYPENFSPNVILRGIFQEVILPNILFVGGGGELAYWLELKDLFSYYRVPFPVLVLRNSFLLIEKRFLGLMHKLKLSPEDLFSDQLSVLNRHVKAESKNGLALDVEKKSLEQIFQRIREKTSIIDSTLAEHTSALQTKAIKNILSLEKKMIRAERRKFSDTKNQISTLHAALFPAGNLQERTENFMLFYSKWGPSFIDMLYQFSLSTEQEFCVIEEKK